MSSAWGLLPPLLLAGLAAVSRACHAPSARAPRSETPGKQLAAPPDLASVTLMRGWLLEARRAEAVRLGAQNFLAAPTRFVAKDEAVGVLAHAASVLPNLTHVVDAIAANADVNAVSILAPEHGFRGSAPAGEGGAGGVDPATGLPIRSVYRKTGNALVDAATRDGARTVVVDLQDVGTRFYTYIWTLYDLLVAFAAARHNSADADLRVIVLDRPNPLGGVAVQGPVVVEPYLASLVGRKSIALRHGMTVGEVAGYFVGEFVADAAGVPASALDGLLTVVPMDGYRRGATFDDLGLPFVPPSPNMPNALTALVYPGMGLFEGVLNFTEGRGTALPFVQVGAPWAGRAVAERAAELAGGACYARFRPSFFSPVADRCAKMACTGVQVYPNTAALPLRSVDPAFDPIRVALALLAAFYDTASPPGSFAWRVDGIGMAGGGIPWIDRLLGSARVREAFDAGVAVAKLPAIWQAELDTFLKVRGAYLLYQRT